jgi:hypothetical protein
MSFKGVWQQQRRQRQQEVLERRQAVSASLNTIKQERQGKAAQLRHELVGFRHSLANENAVHQAELQQFCQRLHAETDAFLTAASDRRHVQSNQFIQELTLFVQRLQQQTGEFLTAAHDERTATAHRMKQALLAFVDDLRTEMQRYLTELEALRQTRATQLNQELIQSRAQREAETQALFQRLATFRAELRQFSQNLHGLVWGENSAFVTASAAKAEAPQNGTKPIGYVSITPNGAVALSTVGEFQLVTQ